MKIAIFLSTLLPGGAERVAVTLANEFTDRGAEVAVVLARKVGSLTAGLSPQIKVVDLKAGSAARSVRPLRAYLKKELPDAILAINFEINLAAALACFGLRVRPKLIMSAHCPPEPYFEGTPRWWSFLMKVATRLMRRQADRFVAVSRGVGKDLVRMGWATPKQLVTIYNPVIGDDIHALAAEDPGCLLSTCSDRPLVVSVGRLAKQKNHALLIRAFARVASRRPAQLIILGEGEERSSLERLVHEEELEGSVVLPGHLTNPFPVVRAASVFALSSDMEGFGNALVEAMALGVPVVSTNCPHGPGEILEGGKWGTLVPTGEPEALADAILAKLDNRGNPATERAYAFTVQAATSAYFEMITECVASD